MPNSYALSDALVGAKLLAHLPKLFYALTAAGFPLPPQTCLAVEDLCLQLFYKPKHAVTLKQFAQHMAPVVCRSHEQQQQFYGLFFAWAQPTQPNHPAVEPTRQIVEPDDKATQAQQRITNVTRGAWRAFACAIALIFTLFVESDQLREKATGVESIVTTEESTTAPAVNTQPELVQPIHDKLKPIPPRQTPLPIELSSLRSAWLQSWLKVLLALPALSLLFWLAILLAKRQVILKNVKNNQADPFQRLNLELNTHQPFASPVLYPPLRAGIQHLTRKINIRKTLLSTLRHGKLTLVKQLRWRRPEYLVLIARGAQHDHRSSLASAMVQQFTQQGISVSTFGFRQSPAVCYATESGKRFTLAQLQQQFANARLIVTGDGDGLFHPLTGAAYPVVAELSRWANPIWLTTQATPWGQTEAQLAHAGFTVAPLSGMGLQAVGTWLRKPVPGLWFQDPQDSSVNPKYTNFAESWHWQQPSSDYNVNTFLHDMRHYMGGRGFTLLCACAAYPQMVGNLAIALDQLLFTDDTAGDALDYARHAREQRLLKLTRLPWCQAGTMPDYLRLALLSTLSDPQKQKVASAYETLFGNAALTRKTASQRGLLLTFTHIRKNGWSRLRDLVRFAPANSPLADVLFADLVFSYQRRAVDFLLPKALAKLLRGKRWGWASAVLPVALALACTLVMVGVKPYVELPLNNWQLHKMMAANARYNIRLSHTAAMLPCAQELKRQLQAWGFTQINLQASTALKTDFVDAPAAANVQLDILRRVIQHIKWGDSSFSQGPTPVNTQSGSDQIEVALATLPTSQSVFRDNLVGELSRDTWQAELEKLRATHLKQQSSDPNKSTAAPIEDDYSKASSSSSGSSSSSTSSGGKIQIIQDTLKDGSQGPKMVVIPSGEFLMGSPDNEVGRSSDEGPQHKVSIRAFTIGQTEVTFADYLKYVKYAGAELPDDSGWGREQRPVINVSWNDANAYAKWLSEQTGAEYRLPSEAEWEYAARAGTTTAFSSGECINTELANFDPSRAYSNCDLGKAKVRQTQAVASYKPSPFGLYDMSGNAWEWVEDCWQESYKNVPKNGRAWIENGGDCTIRVLRGGSWDFGAGLLRSADRHGYTTDAWDGDAGFRLARTLFRQDVERLPVEIPKK